MTTKGRNQSRAIGEDLSQASPDRFSSGFLFKLLCQAPVPWLPNVGFWLEGVSPVVRKSGLGSHSR